MVCHAQWYIAKTIKTYMSCLTQVFMKCGLPHLVMSDNGSPTSGGETRESQAEADIMAPSSQDRRPDHIERPNTSGLVSRGGCYRRNP